MTNSDKKMKKTTQLRVQDTSQHQGGKIWDEMGGA